jgi:hypothetical protein
MMVLNTGSFRMLLAAIAAVCAMLVSAQGAGAVAPAAGWSIHSFAAPSTFSEGDTPRCLESSQSLRCDAYQVTVRDAGSRSGDGSTVTLTDALPAGLTVQRVAFTWSGLPDTDLGGFLCTTVPVRCQLSTNEFGLPPVAPDDTLTMTVYVSVDPGTTDSLASTATVSGGGAPEASTSIRNAASFTASPFGVGLGMGIAGVDGAPDTQAGSHPYELALRIDLNNQLRITPTGSFGETGVEDVRSVVVDLPLGFLGSAIATPQCTFAQLSSHLQKGVGGCPADTVLGHIRTGPPTFGTSIDGGLYNMVAEHGVAAEFGYIDSSGGAHALYSSVVPTAQGYVLRTTAPEIPQVQLDSIEVTLYGNPSARDGGGNAPVALFTNPSSCSGAPLVMSIHADSWQNPGRYNADGTPDFSDPHWAGGTAESPPVTGCNLLQIEPAITAQPETTTADTPTGLDIDVKVPQGVDPETLATPPLRNAVVTLPDGLTINPSAATGLGACSEAQIGLGSAAPPTCPESSKIGTVRVESPSVASVLTGSIYLATQNANPFHSLLAGYIVVDDPTTGVVVKVPGNLTPDPQTGQITGVITDIPQFQLSDVKLHFFGGPRGELSTPQGCGTFTTTTALTPWSAPDSGPAATPSDSFSINSGCTNAFTPAFTAGSTNPQAAGYSPFTLSFSRNDGEQNLAGVSVTLPPGLLGKIAGIPLCTDANANNGTCPEASRVGSVQVGAGVGPNPLFVSGKAYLTGPYNGGPYGLVVQVPAVAGPFDLGMVSVRQALRIDPHTAQVTAVSDSFPTILDGIPLRVRRVDVTLDRPGFTFNPTNCTPMAITATLTSTQGASSNLSSRFQAGGCRELAFKPSFKVSTQANTSKKNGASLDVKVGYPQGAQANIRSVAVSLPKQLPARLTTIQQACLAATFAANPAACPAGSNIGTATATTPVLASPVTGPAYLVSHGGAAFPDLVVVLQGEGITLDLVGSIDIKHGVTSSTFASVPDAPISSFELKLPEGPHSGLAAVVPAKAKGNLCGTSLSMPTTLSGQNGAVVKQTTKIAVTGCATANTRRAHGKKHKAKPKHRKKKGGKK